MVLHQRAVGIKQPAQGYRHGPKLLEFKEHLDTTPRHGISILGGPVQSQKLHSIVLVGPFQLWIFYSMNTARKGTDTDLSNTRTSIKKTRNLINQPK